MPMAWSMIPTPVTVAFGSRDRVLPPVVTRRRGQLPRPSPPVEQISCAYFSDLKRLVGPADRRVSGDGEVASMVADGVGACAGVGDMGLLRVEAD
jgi:hypothetical protein